MTADRFGLLLFTTDGAEVAQAVAAGIDGIVVDWEQLGKAERQAGWDTQVNRAGPADLRRVRAATASPVICRLNAFGPHTPGEVAAALEGGADELLLPMVSGAAEVEALIDLAAARARVGILIETDAAVEAAEQLGRLPLARVYVGLNDLAIDRDAANIFEAVADGTVEHVRACVQAPFGFGGLTLPDRGSPISCRLLIAEMARLGAEFTFLRRSFLRDTRRDGMAPAVPAIRAALAQAGRRGRAGVARDRAAFAAAVESWAPPRRHVAAPAA